MRAPPLTLARAGHPARAWSGVGWTGSQGGGSAGAPTPPGRPEGQVPGGRTSCAENRRVPLSQPESRLVASGVVVCGQGASQHTDREAE